MNGLHQTEDSPLMDKSSECSNLTSASCQEPMEEKSLAKPKRGIYTKGYICMLVAMLGYVGSLSSAQVAGNKTSIFIVNICRFIFEIGFSLICSWAGGHSLKISKQYIIKMVMAAIFNFINVTLFYLSSTLLPVGTLDGIFGGIYIATSTLVDAIQGQISRWSVIAAVIAGTGLIMITQPWTSLESLSIAPCDVLDNKYLLNTSVTYLNNSTDVPLITNGYQFQWIAPERLGYIFMVIATLSSCVADFQIRSIVQKYTIYSFLFWAGIIQSVITVIILSILAHFQISTLYFPSGTACLSFSIVFIIIMIASHILLNITLIYLPVSKAAMVTPVATIALYIIQRTALKMFHPGHANITEVFGIIAIVIACILAPLVSIFYESVE